jgi:hypothetical protein
MAQAYTAGDSVPFAVNVYDATQTLSNATSMTLTVTLPDSTTAGPYTVTPTTTGVYSYNYVTTLPGRYLGQWTASGTNAGGEPQAFYVFPANPVVTLGEIKQHLSITSTADDDELIAFIAAAIPIVESIAGPITPQTYTLTLNGGRQKIALPYIPTTITSITETGLTLIENQDFVVDYTNGIISRGTTTWKRLFRNGQSNIVITYTTGPSNVTANVQMAVKELVRYMWRQVHGGNASFQDGYVSQAAVSGVSQAMMDRIRMILGKTVIGPSVV